MLYMQTVETVTDELLKSIMSDGTERRLTVIRFNLAVCFNVKISLR